MTLPEYSRAILTRDIPTSGLVAGDVGVVVLIHQDSDKQPVGYELELFAINGDSLDTVSVGLNDVRAAGEQDRAHARSAA
jgi:Domain of unknown function (DUF4926)